MGEHEVPSKASDERKEVRGISRFKLDDSEAGQQGRLRKLRLETDSESAVNEGYRPQGEKDRISGDRRSR